MTHLRRIQRLTAQTVAAIAAMATVLAQPMLSPCQCSGLASAEGCCAATKESACCGANSCCAVAAECRCTSANSSSADESGGSGCSCAASSSEIPATAPAGSVRVADAESGSLLLAAPAPTLANLGLHGSAWATAFDLEAPGSPPGIRLHALLSVWRN